MASLAEPAPQLARNDDRFFLIMALVMAGTITAGFVVQLAAGRSSFGAPLLVHAHAVVFFGWVVLYVLQNGFVASGRMALHRTLGWIGTVWVVAMIGFGIAITVALVRKGGVPFFFTPGYFLVMNPVTVLTFAGLTAAAVAMRKRTDWHRRLHYCGMAMLCGPGLGRLLPMPFLIPWAGEVTFAALLIFPLVGVIADLRRTGRVHPAWWWGIGALLGAELAIHAILATPLGAGLYALAVSGSPGAGIAPFDYPPFPPMP